MVALLNLHLQTVRLQRVILMNFANSTSASLFLLYMCQVRQSEYSLITQVDDDDDGSFLADEDGWGG